MRIEIKSDKALMNTVTVIKQLFDNIIKHPTEVKYH
jgi:hypothetical protein